MEHPLIGVWTVEIHEPGKPHPRRVTHAYHPDGTMAIVASTYTANGVWAPTGERSAKLSALVPIPPGEGFDGWFTVRATTQVADDGEAFQTQAVVSRPTPSGATTEHPATLVAKRFTLDS